MGIVSPLWVYQSLRAGRQQRCLAVSADASRHLPAASGAAASSQLQQCEQVWSDAPSSCQTQHSLSRELLLSREARERMLSQLAGVAGARLAGGIGAAAFSAPVAAQQASTPAELLSDVLWSVLEAPQSACKESQRPCRGPIEE